MKTLDFILSNYEVVRDVNQAIPSQISNAGRDDLADLLSKLDFRTGVEVGVADGEYSEVLMQKNPQMKLYGIDPYVAYDGFDDYIKKSTFENFKSEAHQKLDKFDNYVFMEEFSPSAAKHFTDKSLDFVYLDGNHKEPYITNDINAWVQKVRPGGILSGHDYMRIGGRTGIDGNYLGSDNWAAKGAVNKYVADAKLELFLWGLDARLPGLKRENSRSWMVIVP